MSETIRQVPLSKLIESPDNPRKLFGNLTEFSKTLKGGILQPLVARELDGGQLELVIGHRRFRGAKLVGLKEVPVIVREYTREEAQTAMVIENTHREDVNPMELADAFAKMRQDFELSGDKIAERVRMPSTKVYDLLSLHDNLFEAAQKALLEGKIDTQHGVQFARVRGERLQNAALAEGLRLAKPGEKPSVRAVTKLIQQKYVTRRGTSRQAQKRHQLAADQAATIALRRRVLQRLLVRVAELVERKHHLDENDMRLMAIAASEGSPNADATREVLERRGISGGKLGKLGATQLRSLVVELALAPFVGLDDGGGFSSHTKAVAKAYGLSLAEMERNVAAEQAAESLFKKE